MATGVTITDDDRKLRALMREVAKLRRAVVTVGVHEDTGLHDGSTETVASIAALHEYGAPDHKPPIPQRSFLQSTVDNSPLPLETAQQAAADVCNGVITARVACERVGVVTAGAVKRTIHAGIRPALAPATVKRRMEKGAHGGGLASHGDSTTPLDDSGQLLRSITHKVSGNAGWGSANAQTQAGVE